MSEESSFDASPAYPGEELQVYDAKGERLIGFVCLGSLEEVASVGTPASYVAEEGDGEWEQLHRLKSNPDKYFLVAYSFCADTFQNHYYGPARLLGDRSAALQWIREKGARPPDDMIAELGLTDFSTGPGGDHCMGGTVNDLAAPDDLAARAQLIAVALGVLAAPHCDQLAESVCTLRGLLVSALEAHRALLSLCVDPIPPAWAPSSLGAIPGVIRLGQRVVCAAAAATQVVWSDFPERDPETRAPACRAAIARVLAGYDEERVQSDIVRSVRSANQWAGVPVLSWSDDDWLQVQIAEYQQLPAGYATAPPAAPPGGGVGPSDGAPPRGDANGAPPPPPSGTTPSPAATRACPVRLIRVEGSSDWRVEVDGQAAPNAAGSTLTRAMYTVVNLLVESYPEGLTQQELIKRAKIVLDPGKSIREAIQRCPALGPVLRRPGKARKKGEGLYIIAPTGPAPSE